MTNKDFFIEQWNKETKITTNAVKALPTDLEKLKYSPDAKSRTAMQIINHILAHPSHLAESIDTGIVNENDKKFSSIAEAISFYETKCTELTNKLSSVDENTWETKVLDFAHNGHKVFERSMKDMFWAFLFDIIHHRGQLSTYYRAMGVRNPSIYGPTAEDIEEMMAARNN